MTGIRIFLLYVPLSFAGCGYAAEIGQPIKTNQIVISFKRFSMKEGEPYCADFVVSNCTARAAWFYGYSSNSPLYTVQFLKDGKWDRSPAEAFCATGIDRHRLDPHQVLIFPAVIKPHKINAEATRVGISCSFQANEVKGSQVTYWSNKVNIKGMLKSAPF
jgi:hypothetical protein